MMKKSLLLLLMVLVSAGCATTRPPWVPAEDTYKTAVLNCTVELPRGWMRKNQDDLVLVTRDGVLLQNITLTRIKVGDPLKFTKKTLDKNMLPQELAEVALDDVSSNPDLMGVKIEEKGPAAVAGVPGFRAVYSFKTREGLRVRSVRYGFIKDEWFYTLRYTATQRHYYDKDLATFQKVYESLRLQ